MTHPLFRSRHGFYGLLVSCVALAAGTAYADTPPQPDARRAALMDLARGFVDKVGGGFAQADRYLATILPDDMRAQDSFVDIPDGEILLLQIALGNLRISDTVLGIKQGRDVMLSLRDFASVARFAIDVRPEEGIAEGWYIRENQIFRLDKAAGSVAAAERRYDIAPDDILVQDDDIFVRGQALAEWLEFSLKISLSDQMAKIDSDQPWPVEEQLARKGRHKPARKTKPELPRAELAYEAVSVPYADLNVRQSYTRAGDEGKGDSSTSYIVNGAGDFLGHTTRVVATGTDEEKLASARVTLSKESDRPELLGPLKARKYEFGDISPSRVPLAGAALPGLGVRVTSAQGNSTSGATTQIIGEGTPGWDVEIERAGLIVGGQTVGNDGRYVFDDVPLTAGENLFTITFYGPQGEIREEFRRIVSSPSLTGGDTGVYDVSVTAADTEIWSRDEQDTSDQNNPQFSGLYEFQVTPEMTAAAGARSVTQDDERKNYIYAGTARSFGGLLTNLNGSYDLDGAVAADAALRFRLFGQSLGGTFTYTGEDYGMVNGAHAPARYGFASSAGGELYANNDFQLYYDGRSEYNFADDGSKDFGSVASLTASYRDLSLGQSIQSTRNEDADGNDTKAVTGSTTLRGSVMGTRVRAATNYQIKPEFETRNYTIDLTRRVVNDVRGNFRVTHEPSERFTEARASLNWNEGRFSLSPTVTYDTDNNLGAYLSVNVAAAYDPATGKGALSGRNLSGSGGFSAFVYLDKDGDKVFSEGVDEPVENAPLRAVQLNQVTLTDAQGKGFLYSLIAGRATDVVVDEDALPDPFWVSAFEGVSILPRPGYTAHAEFPLHISGEIDGTLRVISPGGGGAQPLRGVMLALYDNEGKRVREAVSAMDGFYLFDRVPPGKYLLTVDDADAKRYKFARSAPQVIEIGYEGTTLYGNDITMQGGDADVPVGFAAGLEDYMAANPHITPAEMAGGTVLLNLGSYRSQMLMGLVWYKIRARYAGIVGGGRLLVPPSQSYAAPKTGLHELLVEMPGVGIQEAFARCRQLAARGMVCGVEIIPGQGVKAAQAQGVGGVVN